MQTEDKYFFVCSVQSLLQDDQRPQNAHDSAWWKEVPHLQPIIKAAHLKPTCWLVHSGEKPFSCKECNYSSTTASYLKKHMLIHSGETLFSCTQCNYSCTTAANLKQHLQTHSGEKPFICTQCNYSSCWPQEARADSFRRKTFQIHTVWILLHTSWWPPETHANTLGREANQMWAVWILLHTSWEPQTTQGHSHWRKALCM